MAQITALNLTSETDPEVMDLINRFASLQQLKPTTAIKRFLLRNLPQAIKEESLRDENGSSVEATEQLT